MPGSNAELVLVPLGEDLAAIFQVRFGGRCGRALPGSRRGNSGRPVQHPERSCAAVVRDPFGNVYALRDDQLGELVTDEAGHVLGTEFGENSGA